MDGDPACLGHLQPDINVPAFLPIVDVTGRSVTVAGDYSSLGAAGTSFRIYAPPGVVRRNPVPASGPSAVGALAGHSLYQAVDLSFSRYLYKGYRYETPLAGLAFSDPPHAISFRQTGGNFAGMYYTLHRHYDPVLMRFTSPDPLAAPFFNLYHYVGNSPYAYFDPDGLSAKKKLALGASASWSFFKAVGKLVLYQPLKSIEGLIDLGTSIYDIATGESTIGDEFRKHWDKQTRIFTSEGLSEAWDSVKRPFTLEHYKEGLNDAARAYASGNDMGSRAD